MNSLRVKLILEAIDQLTAPIRQMSARFTAHIKQMMVPVRELGQSLKMLGTNARTLGQGFSLYLTTGLSAAGFMALKSAANIEQITISLEGVAGSAAKASALMEEIKDFAKVTPFEVEGVANSARMLLNAGYDIKNIRDYLKSAGDVASGAKAPMEDIAYIMAKVKVLGKAQAQELNMLMERGIPIIDALAKVMNRPRQQIMKLASQGKISADKFTQAMKLMTEEGGVYFNQMEKQSRSLNGLFSTMRDSISQSMAVVGETIAKVTDLAPKIEKVSDFVLKLANGFATLPGPVKSSIVWAGIFLALLGPLLMVVGQITIGIGGLIIGFGMIAPALGPVLAILATLIGVLKAVTLGLLATPFGWFLLGAAALAGAVYLIKENWGSIKDFFAGVWDGIKDVFQSGVDWVMDKLKPVLDIMATIKEGFGGSFSVTSAPVPVAGPPVMTGTPEANRNLDAGGTLRIEIDSTGAARLVDSRPNDRRMEYQTDTGLLMGTP